MKNDGGARPADRFSRELDETGDIISPVSRRVDMRPLGRRARRLLFVLGLAGRRLSRRIGPMLLAAGAVAVAAATLATLLGAGTVARDESLDRARARLPVERRAVRVAWFGVLPEAGDYRATLDPLVRRTLRAAGGAPLVRALTYRETSVDGKLFDLAAADGLRRWVRLRSGRLPRGCSPASCEVVQVAGFGPIPKARGLPLRVVGRGDLVSPVPFLRTTAYGRNVDESYAFSAVTRAPPFLLAGDVEGATRLPLMRAIHRSYGWVLPLRTGDVHTWTLGPLERRVASARSALEARSVYFDLADPLTELDQAASDGRVAARRFLLVGGQGVALLLAFVVLAAAGARSEADATRRRLRRFGARTWQIAVLSIAEAGGLAAAATLLGWAIGVGLAAVVAAGAGTPAGAVLAHSVASGGGILLALGLATAAALVVLLSLHAPTLRLGRLSLSVLDVVALCALAALALSLARGAADATALAEQGRTGVLLFLLPPLIAFVAAVAAVRLVIPAVRLLERPALRLPLAGRLAALSLARNPGYAGAVVAFLLTMVGLAVFSATYRATLLRAEDDQARFASPADVTLKLRTGQGGSLVDARRRAAYRRLARGRATPILRLDGQVGSGVESRAVTLVGISAGALRELPFWRHDFASRDVSELARAVDPGRRVTLQGLRVPPDARALLVPVNVAGDPFHMTFSIATRDGTFVHLDLPRADPGRHLLAAAIPRPARGGLLVSFAFAPTLPEVHGSRPARGNLVLGPPAVRTPAGSTPLAGGFRSWLGVGGVRARDEGSLSYFLTNDVTSRFRARQVTDGGPVPVIASTSLAQVASPERLLPVRVGDDEVVGRVVGTLKRFPSVYGDVVLADRGTLATALNATSPGSALVRDVWLSVPADRASAVREALRRPPFGGVAATFRSDLEDRARDDPLARVVVRSLAATSVLAFVLALLGMTLALAADVRDERRELLDLEAQGVGPAALRRHLRVRLAVTTVFGILGGVALGAVLSLLVVSVVLVTAGGALPEPPLVLAVDWPLLVAGVAGFLLAAALLTSSLTWHAFRGRGVA
jgi:hypothetical protein